ncbi:unnamed protein product [Soboliphyme baturini]|uniref:G_PROTEIN_RECEP_F1_2 domain-containing protein n=1 Tax=Soboliphyme baturini TaxID=241478 RepID=A0A183J8N1_9BILA|nr:unnamed protein product [Soboliphyme baturini]
MFIVRDNSTECDGDAVTTGVVDFAEGVAYNASLDPLVFFQEKICSAVVIVINIFGIFGSVMIFVVLFRNTYAKHEDFRILLSSSSIADLSFNALCIPVTLLSVYQERTVTSALIDTYLVISAFAEASSLLSDLLTIVLMLTRYVSLLRPTYWYSKSLKWKRRFCVALVAVSCLLCSVKLRDACQLRSDLDANNTASYNYAFLKFLATELTVWSVTSLLVMPVTVLSVMLYLIMHTILLLRRRLRVQAALHIDEPSNRSLTITDNKTEPVVTKRREVMERRLHEHRNTTSLILLGGVSMILCRAFCIFLAVTVFIFHEQIHSTASCGVVSLESTRSTVTHLYVAVILSTIFECITRSCQFYSYVLFNVTFRTEFCKIYRSACVGESE